MHGAEGSGASGVAAGFPLPPVISFELGAVVSVLLSELLFLLPLLGTEFLLALVVLGWLVGDSPIWRRSRAGLLVAVVEKNAE